MFGFAVGGEVRARCERSVVAGPLSNLHRAVGPFPTLEVTRLTTPAAVAGLSTRQPGRTTTLPSEKIPGVIAVNKDHARSHRTGRVPQRTARKARHRAPAANSGHTPGSTYGSEVWGSSPSERAE